MHFPLMHLMMHPLMHPAHGRPGGRPTGRGSQPPAAAERDDHFLAFTSIACTLICYSRLTK